MLTQDRLKELLHYDPETGVFTWLCDRGGKAKAGTEAGVLSTGYVRIMVDGKRYLAHRLASLYVAGAWPAKLTDHEDRNRANNVWTNIRQATRKQNGENRNLNRNSSSGVRGVSWDARLQKFRSRISHNYKHQFLGLHDTVIDAVAARLRREREIYTHAPFTI
jgi:hypothetical protein